MSNLKLVPVDHEISAAELPSRWPFALGALLLAAAGLATLRGADPARRTISARDLASQALEQSLVRGNRDASVRSALIDLRRRLGRRPLDSTTRVAYASLLLGLSRSVEETRVAAFHADLAADLSPVTVPVVRASAVILARTGDIELCIDRVKSMFGYDTRSASNLLILLEPRLTQEEVERGIGETPQAWLAWIRRLRRDGREADADAWLEGAFDRWPDHPETLAQRAAMSVRNEDWETLTSLFAGDRRIPEQASASRALVFRALSRARERDVDAARSDVAIALRLEPDDPRVQVSAGDVFAELGQFDQARRLWSRALYALEREDAAATRKRVLLRLARLEDRDGAPADALRFWRAILELDPEHREARRRVEDLTGFSP